MVHRVFASAEQVAADEERLETSRDSQVTPISQARSRQRGTFTGVIRSVVLRPHGGTAALEVELYDGTGALDLMWLGRRRIAGIQPGARLRVHGLVVTSQGRYVLFNPRYELKARHGESL